MCVLQDMLRGCCMGQELAEKELMMQRHQCLPQQKLTCHRMRAAQDNEGCK